MNNRLIIASAGSGKTTLLVREALKISETVLITTYTEANEAEIKRKFIELNNSIPNNITIQTWFSFLLQHGVKPYQGKLLEDHIKGLHLTNTRSGLKYPNSTIYYAENENLKKFYFTNHMKIYSDKLSKFVVRANEKSNGEVINRLSRIFSAVFVDEVQDLAGYDLDILVILFKAGIKVTLAGDPRQVTYLTHSESKNSPYKDGLIKKYIQDKCKNLCSVDETTLKYSHRNNLPICAFSSKLFPHYPESHPCTCPECRNIVSHHNGVFLVATNDVENYKKEYQPVILKYNNAADGEWNFGKSKGLGFDRVLLIPTAPIVKYLKDGKLKKMVKTKSKEVEKDAFEIAKFYVAITRARYSVAILHDFADEKYIDGITKWSSNF